MGSGQECECSVQDVGWASAAGAEEAAREGPFDGSRARTFVWSLSPLSPHCWPSSSFGGRSLLLLSLWPSSLIASSLPVPLHSCPPFSFGLAFYFLCHLNSVTQD